MFKQFYNMTARRRRRNSHEITKLLSRRITLKPTIIALQPAKSRLSPIIKPNMRTLYPIKEINRPSCISNNNNNNNDNNNNKFNTKKVKMDASKKHKLIKDFQWNTWNVKSTIVTSTYTMKTRRSRTFDLHSLAKANLDRLHPLPEKAEEPLSLELSKEYCEPHILSPTHSNEEDKLSLSTSSIRTDGSTSTFCCESLSSVRTLGYTSTGRSSAYSWGNDDEFDRKATAQVRSLFDEVDMCLFETNTNLGNDLQGECDDWSSTFPYLRLLGTQLLPEKESGTQMIARETDGVQDNQSTAHNSVLGDSEGEYSGGLIINGAKMDVSNLSETTLTSEGFYMEEEVFAIDGDMEEFIAFDYNSSEIREERSRNKRPSMPPITPHNFAHDSALNECFDRVWSETVRSLTGLLKLYIQVRAKKELERHQQLSIYDATSDQFLESSMGLPPSSDIYGTIHSQMKSKSSSSLRSLKDLMTIRSVSLNQRAPSVNMNIIREDELYAGQNRPESTNTVVSHRHLPKFRTTEQQFHDRMMSAKGQKRAIRLQPLQTPKAVCHVESKVGGVRGTRLSMSGERSFSPPCVISKQQSWGHKNGALPPLDRMITADPAISYKDNQAKNTKRNTRASSAVIDQTKHSSQRDRTNNMTLPDSRPNTLQTFRTDLYNSRRPSTNQQQRREGPPLKPGLHSHAQTSNDVSYHHTASQSEKTGETQHEFDDFVLWGHGPPLISQQQRRGKSVNGTNVR